MAYSQGTASNFESLKSAVESTLVADGWTFANGILSTQGAYFALTAATNKLSLIGGTGESSGILTGAGPRPVKIGGSATITMPFSYEIHSFKDALECIVVVKHDGEFYQQLSFGKSLLAGIGGSGGFYTGTSSSEVADTNPDGDGGKVRIIAGASAVGTLGNLGMGCGLFFNASNASSYATSYVHTGLDVVGWRTEGYYLESQSAYGVSHCAALLTSLPNLSNSATVLLPIKAIARRPSNRLTVVLNLNNVRYCRNDNIDAGEIITYGGEKWKVYPFYRKDGTLRDGVHGGAKHSGTFAYAVRYLGP